MPNHQEKTAFADVCANYQGIRVLVLGASGFIGRWVARALSRCGAHLHLVVRDPATAQRVFDAYGIRGDLVQADLEKDPDSLEMLCKSVRPAIAFNLAGYGIDRSERDENLACRINEQLVQVLCDVMDATRDRDWPGQAIVHVGSALEYGEIGGDLNENSVPNPTTLYGQSKLAGTLALAACCRRSGLSGTTARLFTVYGPGEHDGRLLPALLNAAKTGESLALTTGRQKRDFTYVEDVAEGLLRIGVTGSPGAGIVNLASGYLHPVREFTEIAAKELDIPAENLQFGVVPTRAEEMDHQPVSIRRLRQAIAWSPLTEIQEGVRRTADFFKTVGVE